MVFSKKLADDGLSGVSGGSGSGKPNYLSMAKAEGRTLQVFKYGSGLGKRIVRKPDLSPCGCGDNTIQESIFASHSYNFGNGCDYFECKCYACGKTWESITISDY